MNLKTWIGAAAPLAADPGIRRIVVGGEDWRRIAEDLAAAGGRLLALWGQDAGAGYPAVFAAYATAAGLLLAELPFEAPPGDASIYPGLQDLFPFASRMQRAVYDLYGLRSTDADTRPWLRHAPDGGYEFVRVEGDGVHEIPVGPVHAGIIEPGHFRFSVVGEKVLRLEERLGFTHKGIERRFLDFDVEQGCRLAARVCGDSAVAYSWAYCRALEDRVGVEIPRRANWLRALALELERIANHLGDLGALGNDAGFAFGLTQFSRLKEGLLRATEAAFGRRYLLDTIAPGGVCGDLPAAAGAALERELAYVAAETVALRDIYDEHAGLRDRFVGAGAVAPELAARLGLTGLAGRASGQAYDLRTDLRDAPYDELRAAKCGAETGDVAARVTLRFDEVAESCRLGRRILGDLPAGGVRTNVPPPAADSLGIGIIEGWRGPVLVALAAAAGGRIRRCHPHDPSWQNWPALEHAVIDNIVPDFPLINKSFNLAYSGHDL
ncbi:MAG: Ni,Fe-hydrogenase III large subunit [Steroidobacteraceae bacterium]|nr:Ni,Fe-hydrogenase III large subunit [Steroidobacteraceae bacterium]